MRDAPILRGGLGLRTTTLFVGFVVMALAIVLLLESGLGLAPWDVFHLGLAAHSPLTIGTASVAVGLAVLVLAWALGQPPGFGTVANAIVIGVVVDLLRVLPFIDGLSERGFGPRLALLCAGVGLFGLGTALYIGAGLGAGPRDSMMLVLSRRMGVRIAVVRGTIEVVALSVGWALGGTAGIGTVAVALLLGPVVESSFWLLLRLGVATRPSALAEAVTGALEGGATTARSGR